MVPPEDPPPATEPRSRWPSWRWWALGIALTLITGAVVFSRVVAVPYVRFAPGDTYITTDQISVTGTDTYPSRGEIRFTTVRVRNRVTIWEAVATWLDPAVELRDKEAVTGGRSADEVRQFNVALMDQSVLTAQRVALSRLGIEFSGTGVVVTGVIEGLPVADVLETGDQLVSFAGQPVGFAEELVALVGEHQPGDQVEIGYVPREDPEGDPVTDLVELSADDQADPVRTILGIFTGNAGLETDFDITLDSAGVGGPSAGLAWTLGIIDLLTPGDLTDGHRIAATGTIALDGTVGAVDGLTQKVHSARRDGADLFLIPPTGAAELAELRKVAGDTVEVQPVSSLQEALDAIATFTGAGSSVPAAA